MAPLADTGQRWALRLGEGQLHTRRVDHHEMVSTTTFSGTVSAPRLVGGTGNAGTHTSGPVLSLSLSIRPSLKQGLVAE